MLSINPKIGFYDREKVDTENHKVFSACLLNSGIPGVSMKVEDEGAAPATQILILGCNRGFLLKYEKQPGEKEWVKTGESRLEQSVTDILQIQPMNVLACQDEATYDVVDVASM